jgi:hypothetical protein
MGRATPDRGQRRDEATGAVTRATGQATVELVGGLVALLFVSFVGFQLLAFGYGAVMADHAAEAAALALANGEDPARAAGAAVPGWPKKALRIRSASHRVDVTLFPPSPLSFLRGRLAATGKAAVWQRPRGSSARSF